MIRKVLAGATLALILLEAGLSAQTAHETPHQVEARTAWWRGALHHGVV